MAELKFDHTKDLDLLESLGLSENDLQELNAKFASISHFILTKAPKKSELVEKIAQTFSYNELLLATTFFIVDKTNFIIENNPILAILAELSNLKKGD